MEATAILRPVIVMGLLTTAMLIWMYATRIPAMAKAGIDPGRNPVKADLDRLPPEVTRIADNYNHLFEQPTLFYAVALAIAVLGHVDSLHVACAWIFVVLRIAHSLVQAAWNYIPVRFAIFSLSWVVLAIMIFRETFRVF